jgi:archaellum component FlaG (FlaF/FlaG flagellin family)
MVALLAIVIVFGAASAQSQPSSKVTAQVGDIAILDSEGLEWTTILSNNLRTPNQKDLFVDVSLECGLYTRTLVKSAGNKDTSTAEAGVEVQVLVDGNAMYPDEVVFCRRTQELTALFGGIMESCTDLNGDGTITYEECVWTPEELELVLDTMNANSFNFILDDLTAGVHTVEVQAKITTATEVDTGEAEAYATIGKGSVTVESVRMIQNEDFLLE